MDTAARSRNIVNRRVLDISAKNQPFITFRLVSGQN